MKHRKFPLNPDILANIVQQNKDLFVVKEGFVFSNIDDRGRHALSPLFEVLRTPRYAKLGRFIYVTNGSAAVHINMLPFDLQAGDILVIPENTYFELKEMSTDFIAQVVSYKNLPLSFPRCTQLQLSETDFTRIGKYLDLAWETLQKEGLSTRTVEHLLTALMNDLLHLHKKSEMRSAHQITRGEQLLQQFFDLVAEHGGTQRKVGFYASLLCVSPNHLSSVVKQQSGHTVLQWLNAQTVLQAKVLLKHSQLSVYEVADRLGFESATFFSRFFKRETGMSPRAYRTV